MDNGTTLSLATIATLVAAGTIATRRRKGSFARPHEPAVIDHAHRRWLAAKRRLQRDLNKLDLESDARSLLEHISLRHIRTLQEDHIQKAWEKRITRSVKAAPNLERFFVQPYAYHFTNYYRLRSIRRRGLQLHYATEDIYLTTIGGMPMWSMYVRSRTYTDHDRTNCDCNQPEQVCKHTQQYHAAASQPIVLRVAVRDLQQTKIEFDRVGTTDARLQLSSAREYHDYVPEDVFAVRYLQGIPPQDLQWTRVHRHRTDRNRFTNEIQGPWLPLTHS